MPVIGITTCRKLEDYRQSILHAGGEPRTLDSSMTVAQALDGIDGLMLTGGGDVAPGRYHEAAHATI
jgi:gamma-glutamyl-gamma-aminobutyrate hydrolase PuuD